MAAWQGSAWSSLQGPDDVSCGAGVPVDCQARSTAKGFWGKAFPALHFSFHRKHAYDARIAV